MAGILEVEVPPTAVVVAAIELVDFDIPMGRLGLNPVPERARMHGAVALLDGGRLGDEGVDVVDPLP